MTGVMTNDRVRIQVFPAHRGDRFFGQVDEILQRSTKVIVGRYVQLSDREGVIPDEGQSWGAPLRIFSENSMGASHGEHVAAEIISYPSARGDFTGKVIQRLGDVEDPLNDIHRVIFKHNLPHVFPKKALTEAESLGTEVREEDKKGREDLRNLPLITIDGVTAKDFDDAICVRTERDGFRLWVAIADVSHYVKEGSAMDAEAYLRGNSTYFPNFVVPMLPEPISNGLCSLNPHVDRLAMVAEMKLDFQGELQHSEFYEAVIRSHARVTYGEAQEVIDGNPPEKLANVAEGILRAADLAKVLMTKRFREGSLDLDIPETQVLVNSDGQPLDIIRAERIFAHRLIEELMLMANISVARFFTERQMEALYRVHEPPKEEDVEVLQRFLSHFGGKKNMSGGKLQKKLTRALQEFAGRPEAQVLNILALRAMSQAKYAADNIGHFGLGFENYTHFTSPIRRYSDLIVHRLLKSQLLPSYRSSRRSYDELATNGNVLSACEQRSVKAERNLVSIKKARFMSQFIGEEFEGIISSVARFGIFVLLRKFDVDGLVKIEELGSEPFLFDDENLMLVGRKTGTQIRIGDLVRIQIAAVNSEEGQIDFVLPEDFKFTTVGEIPKGQEPQRRVDRKSDEKRSVRGSNERDSNQKPRSGKKSKSSSQSRRKGGGKAGKSRKKGSSRRR